ncbi:MAG: TlyA family RNA methyltransferase [Desulfobacteraceae bacterium]|nr:TlyA family RNA methyltransferase [Desulfobacteraceae bacterium]MCF8095952.1 TlyA family RNA methyltransferase [Desulfobacteraceae bacterium]
MSETRQNRKRLDVLVVEKGLAESRHKAQGLIMAAHILVDDHPVDKPGMFIDAEAHVTSRAPQTDYVSRGGQKLAHGLSHFKIDVSGFRCLDVGASTGGFTDCLLQRGAACVYAVDVGYGQLAWKLRQDSRVKVLERTNIRHVTGKDLPGDFDLAAIDVSFISLRIVVPVVKKFMKPGGFILALIKPQFEVGRAEVGKGGVVREPDLHRRVISDLSAFFAECGLKPVQATDSPILGPKGNREFIQLLTVLNGGRT